MLASTPSLVTCACFSFPFFPPQWAKTLSYNITFWLTVLVGWIQRSAASSFTSCWPTPNDLFSHQSTEIFQPRTSGPNLLTWHLTELLQRQLHLCTRSCLHGGSYKEVMLHDVIHCSSKNALQTAYPLRWISMGWLGSGEWCMATAAASGWVESWVERERSCLTQVEASTSSSQKLYMN